MLIVKDRDEALRAASQKYRKAVEDRDTEKQKDIKAWVDGIHNLANKRHGDALSQMKEEMVNAKEIFLQEKEKFNKNRLATIKIKAPQTPPVISAGESETNKQSSEPKQNKPKSFREAFEEKMGEEAKKDKAGQEERSKKVKELAERFKKSSKK